MYEELTPSKIEKSDKPKGNFPGKRLRLLSVARSQLQTPSKKPKWDVNSDPKNLTRCKQENHLSDVEARQNKSSTAFETIVKEESAGYFFK